MSVDKAATPSAARNGETPSTPCVDGDERDLLAAAANGDRAAMERLLLAHYSRLERHVAAGIPPSLQRMLSAEHVLQETFIHAFRDIRRFDVYDAVSFHSWLRAIADHRLTDAIRRLRAAKRGGGWRAVEQPAQTSSLADLTALLAAPSDRPSRAAVHAEAVQAIQVRLAGLPDDQQQAIRLRYLQEQSLDSVAAAMDRSPNAVRGLLHRGKASLREMLGRTSRWWSRRGP